LDVTLESSVSLPLTGMPWHHVPLSHTSRGAISL
jgi:hypothetical protein